MEQFGKLFGREPSKDDIVVFTPKGVEEETLDTRGELADSRNTLEEAQELEADKFATLEKVLEDEKNGKASVNTVQAARAEHTKAKQLREKAESQLDALVRLTEMDDEYGEENIDVLN